MFKENLARPNVLYPPMLVLVIVSLAACGNSSLPQSATPKTPVASIPTQTPTPPVASTPATAPTVPASTTGAVVLLPVAGSYQFTEGPAADGNGNVYFSDINAGKIYQWAPDGNVTVFLSDLNGPNGLAFDESGNLIACEGGNGQLISIDPQGQITVLADQYNGVRFNEPNDLWIDPLGGIYFTDPAYQSAVVQDGEHVYYLSPDRSQVIRVISDMARPNGIVGTQDGKTLYVADHGAGKIFAYDVNSDGTLSNKRLFATTGSDGMTLDSTGNLYLTTPNQVQIYDASGAHLEDISMIEDPTNVTFVDVNDQTLFITAKTSVYILQVSSTASDSADASNISGFTLISPDVVEGYALPTEYTCDGASATLALTWSGAPEGTVGYAVIMHHVASPEDIHWYWILYDIPVNITSLPENVTGIGTLGNNSVNGDTAYAPPCSKGPGEKVYTYTVYALSAQPQLSVPASEVTRTVLLEAIQDITLASAELNVTYIRK